MESLMDFYFNRLVVMMKGITFLSFILTWG